MATERKVAARKATAPAKKAKTPAKKSTARKAPASGRAKPKTRAPAVPDIHAVTPEQRHRRIAEAAYFIALKKGFEKSDPRQNWFEAEQQVDAFIARENRA